MFFFRFFMLRNPFFDDSENGGAINVFFFLTDFIISPLQEANLSRI